MGISDRILGWVGRHAFAIATVVAVALAVAGVWLHHTALLLVAAVLEASALAIRLWPRGWIYLAPLGLLGVFIVVGATVGHGTVFCDEPAIDVHLRSEASIPAEKASRAGAKEDDWDDPVWVFRYTPTGTEGRAGVPYWIFRVMPDLFAAELGGRGYHAFGFDDDDQAYYQRRAGDAVDGSFKMPRGTVLVDTNFEAPLFHFKVDFKRVALNCSACHRGKYLKDGEPVFVDGMPNHTADLQGFKRFFSWGIQDARFNADAVTAAIDRALAADGSPPLSDGERRLYGAVVQVMKSLAGSNSGSWMDKRPDNGPGRIDPFNAVKYEVLGAPDDGTAATLDFPSLWNQRAAMRPWHHYDGNTADSHARNYGSIVGVGGFSLTVNKHAADAVGRWIDVLPPPRWPFGAVGKGDAARGRKAYDRLCAGCHGVYDPDKNALVAGEWRGLMQTHDEGTDEERWKAFPPAAAALLNKFGDRRQLWPPNAFRGAGHGYIAAPLDGIWAKAPYLHNGSVPSLSDLLTAPEQRPQIFCRGLAEYDPERVGFRAPDPQKMSCKAPLFPYDTSLPGNRNTGHRHLPASAAEREDLLAYLRTL